MVHSREKLFIPFFLTLTVLSLIWGCAIPGEIAKPVCDVDAAFARGFNQAQQGGKLPESPGAACPEAATKPFNEAYQKGFMKGISLKKEEAPSSPVYVVVGNGTSWPDGNRSKCSDFKNSNENCFTTYEGEKRELCQACREGSSCFMAVRDKKRQGLCSVYKEKSSCFMALNSYKTDYGWCQHLAEGKTCIEALDGVEREKCERGQVPSDHYFWIN